METLIQCCTNGKSKTKEQLLNALEGIKIPDIIIERAKHLSKKDLSILIKEIVLDFKTTTYPLPQSCLGPLENYIIQAKLEPKEDVRTNESCFLIKERKEASSSSRDVRSRFILWVIPSAKATAKITLLQCLQRLQINERNIVPRLVGTPWISYSTLAEISPQKWVQMKSNYAHIYMIEAEDEKRQWRSSMELESAVPDQQEPKVISLRAVWDILRISARLGLEGVLHPLNSISNYLWRRAERDNKDRRHNLEFVLSNPGLCKGDHPYIAGLPDSRSNNLGGARQCEEHIRDQNLTQIEASLMVGILINDVPGGGFYHFAGINGLHRRPNYNEDDMWVAAYHTDDWVAERRVRMNKLSCDHISFELSDLIAGRDFDEIRPCIVNYNKLDSLISDVSDEDVFFGRGFKDFQTSVDQRDNIVDETDNNNDDDDDDDD